MCYVGLIEHYIHALSFKALPFIVTDSGKVQEIAAKNTFF